MLMARRSVFLQGRKIIETPLLVPSFSSKGFPEVKQLIELMKEYITESALISAYDIHHKLINKKHSFCHALFIDSGGYEASVDYDLSDAKRTYQPLKSWQHSYYRKTLRELSLPRETAYVLVNYDNPKSRLKLKDQIERAKRDFRTLKSDSFVTEFLIKPDPTTSSKKTHNGSEHLDIEKILKNITSLREFQILGVTEKELGASPLQRMINIARIRKALNDANLHQPLHVFGALDPISVPLYFFAGADIFDGLTWLRYGLHKGLAVYNSNYYALNHSVDTLDESAWTRTLVTNLSALDNLQRDMRTFAESKDFGVFSEHAGWFEKTCTHFMSALGGS